MNEPPGVDVPLPGMPGERDRPAPPQHTISGADLPHLLPEAQGSDWRERAFTFITGRDGRGAADGDRAAQMIAAFGPSQRDPARPDVRAAAANLGVSPRSVQRWLAGGGMRPQHAQDLQRKARQAMTTKRGRARTAKAAGMSTPPPGKNAIRVAGVQGVKSGRDGNYRVRETAVQLDAADLERLHELWVEHGEAGVEAFFHSHWDAHYVAGWHFRSIDDITWDNSPY